jgi:hypothetical protein
VDRDRRARCRNAFFISSRAYELSLGNPVGGAVTIIVQTGDYGTALARVFAILEHRLSVAMEHKEREAGGLLFRRAKRSRGQHRIGFGRADEKEGLLCQTFL